MNNQLQIFKNEEFGNIRGLQIDGDSWLVGKDATIALGYSNFSDALKRHVDEEDKKKIAFHDYPELGNKGAVLINESGLYSLILRSDMPKAKQFKRWVTSEVLPSIRKTGGYTNNKKKAKLDNSLKEKEIEARYNNSLVRKANLLLKIAKDNPLITDEYKKVLQSKATEIITGQAILPLPVAERKTYSATDIGKELGISKNKVGSLANKHNLKTDEYGKLFHDKSKYSNKEVESFRYYDNVIPVLAEILSDEKAS